MLDALETAEISAHRAAEAAQRAELQTRRFLSDAAHELRSPVTATQAVAQQVTVSTEVTGHDDASISRLRRYAELLAGETRRAGRLVSDLLDVADIDAGTTLRSVDLDLVDVTAAEVERAAMLAPSVSVRLVGDGSRYPSVPTPDGSSRSCRTCWTTPAGTPRAAARSPCAPPPGTKPRR